MRVTAFGMGKRSTGWLVAVGLALLLGVAGAWAQGHPAPKKKMAKPAATKKAAEPTSGMVKRRDPFRSLLVRPEDVGAGQPLPPGKKGLVIAQLSVTGIVVQPGGNIAVVSMPGRNRAYFLRNRDELFDGYVARIGEDSVIFRQKTTDAFGRAYEKEVVKELSGSGAKR